MSERKKGPNTYYWSPLRCRVGIWGWGFRLGFGVGAFLGLSQILTCISGETDITNRKKEEKTHSTHTGLTN